MRILIKDLKNTINLFGMQQQQGQGFVSRLPENVFNLAQKYQQLEKKNILKDAVKGAVVTRFPPEPSGYMHIGHVKAVLVNYHYSKIYGGKMLFRFDDTNPSKEKHEFVESIKEDVKRLGVEWASLSYSSDYFDLAEKKCRELIENGLAYCDNTDVDLMRIERGKMLDSKCRDQSKDENLAIYEKMLKGEADEYCVRAKIDMKAKNGCMRDPVLYRGNKTPHHRTGTKYKAYPTYDFICPLVDSHEGVTHAMRTNEYSDRIEQYNWMINAMKLRPVTIYEFSRLNFVNTCLSKRTLQKIVDQGIVEGWDDPRYPTVRGVLRRGIIVETLIDFMLDQGASKNANLQEWDKLWSTNAKFIDPLCPRFCAVSKEKVAELFISNWKGPAFEVVAVAAHQKNPQLGERPLFRSQTLLLEDQDAASVKVGEKVTLMKWGNVRIVGIEQQDNGLRLIGEDLPDDKDYKETKKFTWLAKEGGLVDVELVEYDHLIRVKKVEDQMQLQDILNKESKFVTEAIADGGIKSLQIGDFIQFERRGYFRVDNIKLVNDGTKQVYVLIFIPDGKTQGLASIATKLDQGEVNQGKQEIESKSKGKKQEKKKEAKQDNEQKAPEDNQKKEGQ